MGVSTRAEEATRAAQYHARTMMRRKYLENRRSLRCSIHLRQVAHQLERVLENPCGLAQTDARRCPPQASGIDGTQPIAKVPELMRQFGRNFADIHRFKESQEQAAAKAAQRAARRKNRQPVSARETNDMPLACLPLGLCHDDAATLLQLLIRPDRSTGAAPTPANSCVGIISRRTRPPLPPIRRFDYNWWSA